MPRKTYPSCGKIAQSLKRSVKTDAKSVIAFSLSGAKGAYLRSTFSFTGLSKDIPLNPQFYVLYDIGYIVRHERLTLLVEKLPSR
jgi:hypothetical protein